MQNFTGLSHKSDGNYGNEFPASAADRHGLQLLSFSLHRRNIVIFCIYPYGFFVHGSQLAVQPVSQITWNINVAHTRTLAPLHRRWIFNGMDAALNPMSTVCHIVHINCMKPPHARLALSAERRTVFKHLANLVPARECADERASSAVTLKTANKIAC